MTPRFSTSQRLLPVMILALCLIWAGGYVFEARSDPFGGDEIALFIQPLFHLLTVAAIWAAAEALFTSGQTSAEAAPSAEDQAAFGATGLADHRRLALVLSLPAMVIAAGVFGFVLSAAAYVVVLSWLLNERRWHLLGLMGLLTIATVWLIFKTLLGVPLPLWPRMIG